MVASGDIFKGRNVLITGHTGFKGSWITLWLHMLGARVTGVALEPKNKLDAYFSLRISDISTDLRQDINDYPGLLKIMNNAQPVTFNKGIAGLCVLIHLIRSDYYYCFYGTCVATSFQNICCSNDICVKCVQGIIK